MKSLYLDLGMGAAGDMITAALLELFNEGEQDDIIWELNDAGIPGTLISAEKIKGTEDGRKFRREELLRRKMRKTVIFTARDPVRTHPKALPVLTDTATMRMNKVNTITAQVFMKSRTS